MDDICCYPNFAAISPKLVISTQQKEKKKKKVAIHCT